MLMAAYISMAAGMQAFILRYNILVTIPFGNIQMFWMQSFTVVTKLKSKEIE